nr:RNA-directed DNA polymerase, eukaryota [Tanacetum cinerariifolium]
LPSAIGCSEIVVTDNGQVTKEATAIIQAGLQETSVHSSLAREEGEVSELDPNTRSVSMEKVSTERDLARQDFHANFCGRLVHSLKTMRTPRTGAVQNSFADVLKSGKVNPNIANDSSPAIVLDDSCLMKCDSSCTLMDRIKDINALSNLYVKLANESFEKVKLSYLGRQWVLLDMDSTFSKEKIANHGELVDVNEFEISYFSSNKVCAKTKPHVIINETIKVIVKVQVYWIRIEEVEARSPKFITEEEDNSSLDNEYEGGNNENDIGLDQGNEYGHVTSFAQRDDNKYRKDSNSSGKPIISEEPFGIYKLLKRNKEDLKVESVDPQYTPGFTPDVVEENDVENSSGKFSKPNTTNKVMGVLCIWDPSLFVKENATVFNSFLAVTVEGYWIVEPSKVTNEFLKHFTNCFAEPATQSLTFESPFPKCLSYDQNKDIERNVSYDEIKRAVWDYGTNKSHGPNSFNFEFYRRNWKLIDQDVVDVNLFVDSGSFPPGYNSSFIALIPKTQDAKVKVGGIMSRLNSWEDVVAKLTSRLSKWKLKTLSIGGCITLIKSVLSSFPLYYMSSFKKVSASKKNGGLGVSSVFALNPMHGVRGALDNHLSFSRRSHWLDIVCEFRTLSNNDKHSSVAAMLSDHTLSASFRRPPRGGIEEEQLQLLFVTRNFINDSFLPMIVVPTRWIKTIPIKINIFSWELYLDKLPMRLNLSLPGLDIPSIICPICSISMESTLHLFLPSHLARQLMLKVARCWELEILDFISWDGWLLWLNNLRVSKRFKDVFEGIYYTTLWTIWKFHNQVLFGSNQPRLDLLFDEIVYISLT